MEAGWHPDPTGRHQFRWFNGASWTGDVADDGNRAVDLGPMSARSPGRPSIPPAGGYPNPAADPGGTAGSGFAIAGLVLGVVAMIAAVTILFFQIAAVCGVLALVFGIVAHRRARRSDTRPGGSATAAVVLGSVAVVLAVGGAVLFYVVVRPILDGIERSASVADYDLAQARCGLAGGQARYEAALTNRRDTSERFTIEVEFFATTSGERLGSGRATIDDLDAGDTATVVVTAPVASESVLCQVEGVRIGRSPFG